MRHGGFLLRDDLYGALIVDFLTCESRGHRRWWRDNRGCSGIFSIIGILIFLSILIILSHVV
jgi:phage gp46-like protein